MDIDLAALRALEREKEIPLDLLVRTIEQALLLAYHRTEGAEQHARVELDRSSGHVVVWAREGDIVSGVVQQSSDPRMVHVDLGTVEAVLPPAEQVPGESYTHGSRLRCYVVGVRKGVKGPSITVSRTHPNLVRKLFALEVPEIADGSVEIA